MHDVAQPAAAAGWLESLAIDSSVISHDHDIHLSGPDLHSPAAKYTHYALNTH